MSKTEYNIMFLPVIQSLTRLQVIKQDYDKSQLFKRRCLQLLQIENDHFLPPSVIQKQQGKYISLIYKNSPPTTLSHLVSNQDMLQSQIKSLIWQLTRLMLHCERLKINHLRLNLESIVIQREEENGNFLVLVKDFSFGRQTHNQENRQIETNFFQFQHPDLWMNQDIFHNFDSASYNSRYDIWSLGVIIYNLVYKVSAFRKKGTSRFCATILKRFYAGDEQSTPLLDNKFKSVNSFVMKCLKSQFESWQQIKMYLVSSEETFNAIDFDLSFSQLSKKHIQLMCTLSLVFSEIHKQVKYSLHPFWIKTKEGQHFPFVFYLAEDILILMNHINHRFNNHYGQFYCLLKDQRILEGLKVVNESIKQQMKQLEGQWKTELKNNPEKQLTRPLLKQIQQNCIQVVISSDIVRKKNVSVHKQQWKSLEMIFDFTSAIIELLNNSQNRMKLLFQLSYSSKEFQQLGVEVHDFLARETRIRRYDSL